MFYSIAKKLLSDTNNISFLLIYILYLKTKNVFENLQNNHCLHYFLYFLYTNYNRNVDFLLEKIPTSSNLWEIDLWFEAHLKLHTFYFKKNILLVSSAPYQVLSFSKLGQILNTVENSMFQQKLIVALVQ